MSDGLLVLYLAASVIQLQELYIIYDVQDTGVYEYAVIVTMWTYYFADTDLYVGCFADPSNDTLVFLTTPSSLEECKEHCGNQGYPLFGLVQLSGRSLRLSLESSNCQVGLYGFIQKSGGLPSLWTRPTVRWVTSPLFRLIQPGRFIHLFVDSSKSQMGYPVLRLVNQMGFHPSLWTCPAGRLPFLWTRLTVR